MTDDGVQRCSDCDYPISVETAQEYGGLCWQCHEGKYGAETVANERRDEDGNYYWNC